MSGKNIATFGYSVSHLTGEVLTIKKIISHRKIITPIGEITFLQEILQMLQDFLKSYNNSIVNIWKVFPAGI